jgi:hypothetical protein
VSAPASPYRFFGPQPRHLRSTNRFGGVSFTLGLLVAFGLVVYATWLGVAALAAVDGATQRVGATGATTQLATAPPQTAPQVVAATPNGTTMAFDQLWTASDGNTIVAGAPTVGTSAQTGEPVILVPVTLTNNSERDWNPVSTSFVGKLNRATVPESAEGDWMYRSPIVGHTSVTLTKVFVGGPGQFSLTANTPNGVALFSGRI